MKKTLIFAVLATCFGAPVGMRTANTAEDTSEIGLLCKGAGVDPEDVRWRVAAGLSPKQAVDAALSQKQVASEVAAPVEAEAPAKKGGK